VAQGYIFGPNQKVVLQLLDIPPAEKVLQGVVMELEDMACPLVAGIIATSDPDVAFKDADFAMFLGSFPRKPGMQRRDLLGKNAAIFATQGKAMAKHAKPTCKSIVIGNPANTNCLILMTNAPSIPRENFSALTRLDHNRSVSLVASVMNVNVADVKDVFVWGNHDSTQYPDLHHATVNGKQVLPVVGDEWFKNEFISKIRKRWEVVAAARGLTSSVSAAKATADHARDWVQGTNGRTVSMAVCSTGNPYGVPDGLICSFPVTCENGSWKIVTGLEINQFSRDMLIATSNDLLDEQKEAEKFLLEL
jgi:malate dehydrogenase